MTNYIEDKRKNICYLFLLLIISVIATYPFIHIGKIEGLSDWAFHASRIEQIYKNLRSGEFFTFIASSTFHNTGVASFLFYPTPFLYPWAILRFIFNPITSFYLWYFLITYLAFIISFYSMFRFKNDSDCAFLFSLIYVFNSYRLFLGQFVLGEFIAASFLPLVFLGFYQVFFSNIKHGWVILGVGMTLLTYCHILSVIISVEIFLLIFIIYCFVGNPRNLINKLVPTLKSIGLWLLLTLPLIWMYLTNFIGKNVYSAVFGISMSLVPEFSSLIANSLNNSGVGIGIVLLPILLTGWYFIRNDKRYIFIFILGFILFVLSSGTFPWAALKNSPLGIIQIVYRYMSYTCLFLAIIATEVINKITHKLKIRWGIFFVLTISIMSLLSFVSSERYIFNTLKSNPVTHINTPKYNTDVLNHVILDKGNYEKQFMYSPIYGAHDYFPNQALPYQSKIINQIAYIDGTKYVIHSKGSANRITIRLKTPKSIKTMNLPIVCYRNTSVFVNGVQTKTRTSKRGTVLLRNIHPKRGAATIDIRFRPGVFFYLFTIISLVTWIILIYKMLRSLANRSNIS